MSWETEMSEIFRVMLDDQEQRVYSDQSIIKTLVVSAQLVCGQAVFTQDFQADVDQLTITPDPCDRSTGTRDDNFINLVCLKAACLNDMGKAGKAARQGYYLKDGPSAVDSRGPAAAGLALLSKGFCKAFEEALFEFKTNRTGTVGAAILGPFRLLAGGDDRRTYRGC